MSNTLSKSETVKLYFKCMDTADFDGALELFAPDALYLRSPLGGTPENPFAASGVAPVEGRAAIQEFFAQRGKRDTHHQILVEGESDGHWWGEGEAWVGDSEKRVFLVHVTFSAEGLIQRFVAIR